MRRLFNNLVFHLSHLPKSHLLVDSAIIFLSLYFSLFLRLGTNEIFEHLATFNKFVLIFYATRIICFVGIGVYHSMWRYISTYDAYVLAKAVVLSSVINMAFSYVILEWGRVPRSIFFIDLMVCVCALMGVRLLRRMFYESKQSKTEGKLGRNKVLIYGAGANGRMLAQRLQTDPALNSSVLGFIDDDEVKKGRIIGGVKVMGGIVELENILKRVKVDQVIIAISNASGETVKKVLEKTRNYNITPQVIQHFSSRVDSKKVNLFREINLSDLLNRKPANLNLDMLRGLVAGKVVLVTGAGGSIGSEIARQVSRLQPSKLLLLDHSEFSLYEIDKELRLTQGEESSSIIPLLIDIKNKEILDNVFETHRPQICFHAAAYKHVHLVEANPRSAILNNILGTKNLLDLSTEYETDYFINISTDKAVNPAGIMGATKRVCEMLTSYYGHQYGKHYCSVRFGNVLGSSGSLIPLLQKQIREGGPLTITHKDMKRFFMLIPEAVELVLLSAAIAKPGDINVLNMGEPVNIVDIAKNLITLMGHNEEDIAIMYTGLRPGEKMFEELYLSGNELKTIHPDILTLPRGDAMSESSSSKDLLRYTEEMTHLAQQNSNECIKVLSQLINSKYLKLNKKNTHETQSWKH